MIIRLPFEDLQEHWRLLLRVSEQVRIEHPKLERAEQIMFLRRVPIIFFRPRLADDFNRQHRWIVAIPPRLQTPNVSRLVSRRPFDDIHIRIDPHQRVRFIPTTNHFATNEQMVLSRAFFPCQKRVLQKELVFLMVRILTHVFVILEVPVRRIRRPCKLISHLIRTTVLRQLRHKTALTPV